MSASAPERCAPFHLLPRSCAQRFAPLRILGHGGCGVTVLATQLSLGRTVVLKLPRGPLPPGRAGRDALLGFRREARLTAALSHPNVVIVLDHDVDDGVPWIAYEHLTGRSLADVVKHGAMRVGAALEAARQLALALDCAHSSHILHRDVKPSNVMEARPNAYKLIDFGLAHGFGPREATTLAHGLTGTAAYMAPERLEGHSATARSDVYALGVTLHELLTGQCPFRAHSVVELLRLVVSVPAPPASGLAPGVPPGVDALLRRALAKDPAARFASAAQMRRAIEREIARLGGVISSSPARLPALPCAS